MTKTIKIKEIFSSIQGEGPYVGEFQTFVRSTRCNLSCKYCDTDFSFDENSKEYTFDEFFRVLENEKAKVLSLTGGEPLLEADFYAEFLKNYKQKLDKKIYLETNGTLFDELKKVIDFVDVISMDVKLKSACAQEIPLDVFDKFLSVATKKEAFIKVVFDENISQKEIDDISNLSKKYSVLLVLQPKMPMSKDFEFNEIYEKFFQNYKNIRLIPQVHKFLNVR